jgi:hypothetical protein
MNQLRLFQPPAAPKQSLPDKARREARDLLIELLMAMLTTSAERQQSQEEIDE